MLQWLHGYVMMSSQSTKIKKIGSSFLTLRKYFILPQNEISCKEPLKRLLCLPLSSKEKLLVLREVLLN